MMMGGLMSEVMFFDNFIEDKNLIDEINQPKYWQHDLESCWFEKTNRPSNVFEKCVLEVVNKLKTLMDLPEAVGYDYWSTSLPGGKVFHLNDLGERINLPEWMAANIRTYVDKKGYHMNMDDALFQRTGDFIWPSLVCSLCVHTEQTFEGGKYRIITTPYDTSTYFYPPEGDYSGDDLVEIESIPNRLVVIPIQCWRGVEPVVGDDQGRKTVDFLFWPHMTSRENFILNDANYIKEIFG